MRDRLDVREEQLLRVHAFVLGVEDDEIGADALDQTHDIVASHQADRDHRDDARGADCHPEHRERGAAALARQAIDGEAEHEL